MLASQRFELDWRAGWAASRLDRLAPGVRAKREAKVAEAVGVALEVWGVVPVEYAVGLRFTVDLTRRGLRRGLGLDEVAGIVGPVVEGVSERLSGGVYWVELRPAQAARRFWTREQRKGHRMAMRRIRRSKDYAAGVGRWREIVAVMRRQVFGPSVTVEVL